MKTKYIGASADMYGGAKMLWLPKRVIVYVSFAECRREIPGLGC